MHIINSTMCTRRIRHKNQTTTTREGNVELKPVKEHRRKDKSKKKESNKKQKVPQKTGQQTLTITRKQRQTKLIEFN